MAAPAAVPAAAVAPVAVPEWRAELERVKSAIEDIYIRPGCAFRTFWTEWNTPMVPPGGGLGRSRACPGPLTFYGMTPELSTLYARAVTLACANGTYTDLIDVLVWLQTNCPEQGRGLYFSLCIVYNWELAAEHKSKCAYAYIAGALQNRFGLDVIADADNGDVGVIANELKDHVPKLSCGSLPLLAAARVVIYPMRYNRTARNEAALAGTPWLEFARAIVPTAATMSPDDLVRAIIGEELRQAGELAWARRGGAVMARMLAARGST